MNRPTLSDALGFWLPLCIIIVCAIALGYRTDRARRLEDQAEGYSMVFPLGWKAESKDETNLKAEPDAYFGDGNGRSVAVFVHDETAEPSGAADNILAQARSEGNEVVVGEHRRYQRGGAQFERLVFLEGQYGHHYTFAFKDGKYLVISANCAKADFEKYLKRFDSIADSIEFTSTGRPDVCKDSNADDAAGNDAVRPRKKSQDAKEKAGQR